MQTYKFYSKKGERLAIFRRDFTNGTCAIEVYRCSLSDRFTRRDAQLAIASGVTTNGEKCKPTVYQFPKILSNKEFFTFCEQNFFVKKQQMCSAEVTKLVKGKKEIIIDAVIKPKMG